MVTNPQLQVSALAEIQIYTLTDVVPLAAVLNQMFEREAGKPSSLQPKAPGEELLAYFETLLPDFDYERVYPSHIKKVIQWYNLLLAQKVLPIAITEDPTPQEDE